MECDIRPFMGRRPAELAHRAGFTAIKGGEASTTAVATAQGQAQEKRAAPRDTTSAAKRVVSIATEL